MSLEAELRTEVHCNARTNASFPIVVGNNAVLGVVYVIVSETTVNKHIYVFVVHECVANIRSNRHVVVGFRHNLGWSMTFAFTPSDGCAHGPIFVNVVAHFG